MKYLKLINFSILILCAFFISAAGQSSPQNTAPQTLQAHDTAAFLERFKKPEHVNLLQGALWTLTHDYDDFKHIQEVLKTFQTYFEAIGKYENGDRAALESLGSVKGFKDKLAEWLGDDDQSVRAFAAAMLGIAGDRSYAPQIAKLLEDRKYKENDLIVYDRGRAAAALGMLGAREFLPQIAAMLKSKNQYDRAGAVQALRYLGAKEYSKEIAGLLTNKDFLSDDEPSPIFFLVEMDTAREYKNEIIKTMLGGFRIETRKAAIYALVNIEAKETTAEIAKLLKEEFRKEDAAKALALLGAKEYADEIAFLLKDKSGLVRSDAALALGVLQSKKHAGEIAKLLNDKESYVHNYAAVALLLMEAAAYYKAAIPIVEKPFSENAFLTESAFHPLAAEKTRQLTENLKKSFEKAKFGKW